MHSGSGCRGVVDYFVGLVVNSTQQVRSLMSESGPQKKTIEYARKLGYMAHRNYMGPGCEVGWPDVEIFMSHGRTLLIEFKAEGKEPRKIQEHRMAELRRLGHKAVTCYSFEEACGEIHLRSMED